MTPAEALFHKITQETSEATPGKMFGALCIKAPNNKAAVLFKNNNIAFKLPEPELSETLSLDGAKVFDPADGRPMKGWAELPFTYAEKWPELAQKSLAFVKTLK
ncbi:hypothetical protein [Adhaeribacter terreus]|uniref:TfoX N-terminal domain-containing protein n=1 Tax=Adhaeribacter terreus TaxID=529703 RepID=A0ABW0EGF3_9BACT